MFSVNGPSASCVLLDKCKVFIKGVYTEGTVFMKPAVGGLNTLIFLGISNVTKPTGSGLFYILSS